VPGVRLPRIAPWPLPLRTGPGPAPPASWSPTRPASPSGRPVLLACASRPGPSVVGPGLRRSRRPVSRRFWPGRSPSTLSSSVVACALPVSPRVVGFGLRLSRRLSDQLSRLLVAQLPSVACPRSPPSVPPIARRFFVGGPVASSSAPGWLVSQLPRLRELPPGWAFVPCDEAMCSGSQTPIQGLEHKDFRRIFCPRDTHKLSPLSGGSPRACPRPFPHSVGNHPAPRRLNHPCGRAWTGPLSGGDEGDAMRVRRRTCT